MKKGTRLIILLVALVAVCGLYLLVTQLNKANENKVTEPEETIMLIDESASSLAKMSYLFGGKEYAFNYTDGWVSEENPILPLDTEKLDAMRDAACSLAAVRKVSDDAAGNADYGLADPTYKLTLAFTDGHSIVCTLGSPNDFAGGYYFNIEGQKSVYIVATELADAFSFTLDDLIKLDKFPEITPSKVTDVVYKSKLGERKLALTTKTGEDGTETDAYILTNEAGAAAEYTADAGIAAIKALLGVNLDDCVSYRATDDEKAQYGFDEADEITVNYTDANDSPASFGIKAVYTADDTLECYLMFDDSEMIFKASLDGITPIY